MNPTSRPIRWICTAVLAALAACSNATPLPEPALVPRGGDGQHRLALLVAIDHYDPTTPPAFANLGGAVNDVASMEQLLRQRFGYQDQDILVLRNEQASLPGFLAAFDRHLLQQAQKGTEVFLYYVGHGSMVPDPSRAEITSDTDDEARDSTWLLYDSRANGRDGAFDLTDDAIYSLLRRLTVDLGARVVAVTDSCHSGGGTRGAATVDEGNGWRSRNAAFGHQPVTSTANWPGWPQTVQFLDDRQRESDDLPGVVHLAACANTERAWEGMFFPQTDRTIRGAFTFCLVDVLRRIPKRADWQLVARMTGASLREIAALRQLQTPWPQGDLRQRVLGGDYPPPVDGFDVRPSIGRKIVVAGGTLQGVLEGAGLTVVDGATNQDVGTATVLEAGYGESIAQWDAEPAAVAKGTPMLARVTGVATDAPRLRVHVADQGLRRLLAAESLITLSERATAAYLLEGTPPRLHTMEGIPVWPLNDAEPTTSTDARIDFWRRGFREEMQFVGLWRLAEGAGGRMTEAKVEFVTPGRDQLHRAGGTEIVYQPAVFEQVQGERLLRTGTDAEQQAPRGAGTALMPLTILQITNDNRREAHLTVLCLGENRKITGILTPGPDKTVKPGQPVNPIRIHLSAPDASLWPLTRPMRERYVALFTADYVNFDEFLQNRTSSTRGADDSLPPALRPVMQRGRTRGDGPATSGDAGNWGALAADLLIGRPAEAKEHTKADTKK